MARFCPLFSSSKGNSTYIGTSRSGILIDAGVSAKRLNGALAEVGIDVETIGAIFITHEHSDHIKGLRVFANAHHINVYASNGTLEALESMGALDGNFRAQAVPDNGIEINGMFVRPFGTSHDAAESIGYTVVTTDDRKISVATDTGTVTDKMLSAVYGSDLVMLESNHDVGMLRNGPYPYMLKRRILSDKGHLSNEACAEAALRLINGGTHDFCLAHLSKENNMPLLAYQATYTSLSQTGAQLGFDYTLKVVAEGDAPKMTVL